MTHYYSDDPARTTAHRPSLWRRAYAQLTFPFAVQGSAVWWWRVHENTHCEADPRCPFCPAPVTTRPKPMTDSIALAEAFGASQPVPSGLPDDSGPLRDAWQAGFRIGYAKAEGPAQRVVMGLRSDLLITLGRLDALDRLKVPPDVADIHGRIRDGIEHALTRLTAPVADE